MKELLALQHSFPSPLVLRRRRPELWRLKLMLLAAGTLAGGCASSDPLQPVSAASSPAQPTLLSPPPTASRGPERIYVATSNGEMMRLLALGGSPAPYGRRTGRVWRS